MPMPALENLSCSRGAPMGRVEHRDFVPDDMPIKMHLQYVPFIDGCYDRGGAYWGMPANLWRAYYRDEGDEDIHIDFFIRASSRDAAKKLVLEEYPSARFFR